MRKPPQWVIAVRYFQCKLGTILARLNLIDIYVELFVTLKIDPIICSNDGSFGRSICMVGFNLKTACAKRHEGKADTFLPNL